KWVIIPQHPIQAIGIKKLVRQMQKKLWYTRSECRKDLLVGQNYIEIFLLLANPCKRCWKERALVLITVRSLSMLIITQSDFVPTLSFQEVEAIHTLFQE